MNVRWQRVQMQQLEISDGRQLQDGMQERALQL